MRMEFPKIRMNMNYHINVKFIVLCVSHSNCNPSRTKPKQRKDVCQFWNNWSKGFYNEFALLTMLWNPWLANNRRNPSSGKYIQTNFHFSYISHSPLSTADLIGPPSIYRSQSLNLELRYFHASCTHAYEINGNKQNNDGEK